LTWQRVLAFLIDSISIMAILGAPILTWTAFGDIGFLLMSFVRFVVISVCVFLFEGLYGYTLGKYMLGLVVVKSDGSSCTISASILRNLLWLVDQLPGFNLVAMVSILLTDDNQRVGDLVADTVVVRQQ